MSNYLFDRDIEIEKYKWEQSTVSWSSIAEDEEGNITSILDNDKDRAHLAKKQRVTESIRRGLIRYLVVSIDASDASLDIDYRPCRLEATKQNLKNFVREYFYQNPISQLSLIASRYDTAERLTELSGNPKNHEHKIDSILPPSDNKSSGSCSLARIISLSTQILKHIPDYGHREVLIIFSSLRSCDPAHPYDIQSMLKKAIEEKIRISVICLVAEIYVCKRLALETGGTFSVAKDGNHLSMLLMLHTTPAPELWNKITKTTQFVYMGFPKRTFDNAPVYGYDGKQQSLFSAAYTCPRCYTRTSEIPSQCNVCQIQLYSSSHIAKSYHHLFPVTNFIELTVTSQIIENEYELLASYDINNNNDNNNNSSSSSRGSSNNNNNSSIGHNKSFNIKFCNGCLEIFPQDTEIAFLCQSCQQTYCVSCDLFIHDNLHNCPGCG